MTDRIKMSLFLFSITHELPLGAGPEDKPEMSD